MNLKVAKAARYFATPPSEGVRSLALSELKQPLGGAKQVLLAFGYYDTPTLVRIMKLVNKRASVSVVLNGLGGPALDEQLTELRGFVKRHRAPRPQVRLYFSSGIFHPKLVVALRDSSHGVAWVGSANATEAAFPEKGARNQELMVELRGDVSALAEYFRSVQDKADPLEKIVPKKIKSLTAFFRAGALAFKPTTQLQLSFNPFAPLIGKLKAKDKKALGAQTVRNSETTTGIGAFNVARAVGLRETEFEESPERTAGIKVSPRDFGFETALGYWIPAAKLDAFRIKMDKSSERKKAKLETLVERVRKAGVEGLRRSYGEYVGDVGSAFRRAGLEAVALRAGSRSAFNVEGGKAFLERSVTSASRDDFVSRHSRPFFISRMPEIWDDASLTKHFVTSFFEGLLGAHLKDGKGARLHVQMVLSACCKFAVEDEPPTDANGLSEGFCRYLQTYGWSELNWNRATEPSQDSNFQRQSAVELAD